MTAEAREAVGHICRWALTGVAVGFGVLAGVLVLLAGPATWRVAGGWTIAPDFVARNHKYVPFRVRSSCPPRAGLPEFYWRDPGGALLSPWSGARGVFRLNLTAGATAAFVAMRAVANPYAGCVPGRAAGALYLVSEGTEPVVLDARCLLSFSPRGDLAAQSDDPLERERVTRRLTALAEVRVVAYLVPGPLSQYGRARSLLRHRTTGPVLAAATEWNVPATRREMLQALDDVRRYVGRRPVFVTPHLNLARQADGRYARAIWFRAKSDNTKDVTAVADWATLIERLTPTGR